jgi:hypothetical protein
MAKDTYYLKHDTNAAHDPKIESMLLRFGMAGYGRYWRLAELLREQADNRLPRRKWGLSTLAKCWGCSEEEADAFLVALISPSELIKRDGEMVWSGRIDRDMAVLNSRREEAKRFAEKGWQSRRTQNTSQPNANPLESDANPMPTQSKSMLAEQSRAALNRAEQNRAEQQPRERAREEPPAAAFSVSLLRTRLAAAGITLHAPDLDACASKLIAASADESFIAFGLEKCAKAKQRGTWFVKGVLEWDWIAKWRVEKGSPGGNGSAPKKAAERFEPLPLHVATPEDDQAVALEAARTKQRLHFTLNADERKLLGLPVAATAVDTFDDDFPEEARNEH